MSEVKEGGIPLSEYEKDGGVNRGTKHEIHEEDQNEQADYTGDAALANASWQFKTIALITALMLPSMLIWYINITKMTFYLLTTRNSRFTFLCVRSECNEKPTKNGIISLIQMVFEIFSFFLLMGYVIHRTWASTILATVYCRRQFPLSTLFSPSLVAFLLTCSVLSGVPWSSTCLSSLAVC